MKKFINDFYKYFLFVISQTIFVFCDYIFVNSNEPISVHISLFFITLIVTLLTLTVRTAFEIVYLSIVVKVFKRSFGVRDIVKIMFTSMKYSSILAIIFLIIQLIFIRRTAEIYQIVALSIINILYMVMVCIKLHKKGYGKGPIIAFAIYILGYMAMQITNIVTLI